METHSPSRKRVRSPLFSAHVYCGQTAGWIKTALGTEVGLGPGHIVLDGDLAPLPKKWTELRPQFLAHFYCGQTVGCIKMSLGMEVGLNTGDFVLDGDSAPPSPKGAQPPPICCGQLAGWIKMPLGMEVGLGPGDFVLDGDPAPLPKKRVEPLPNFQPISIVAKRLDGSRRHLARRWALVQATLC